MPSRAGRFGDQATAFPALSGKLEFVSHRLAQAGLDPVAGYTPSYEAAQRDTTLAREYPLALVTPADHYFLNWLAIAVLSCAYRGFQSSCSLG